MKLCPPWTMFPHYLSHLYSGWIFLVALLCVPLFWNWSDLTRTDFPKENMKNIIQCSYRNEIAGRLMSFTWTSWGLFLSCLLLGCSWCLTMRIKLQNGFWRWQSTSDHASCWYRSLGYVVLFLLFRKIWIVSIWGNISTCLVVWLTMLN